VTVGARTREALAYHGMIGRSAPMQALFRRIERVAPLDVPVLILGETGTGKELVARAIQALGPRREGRFEIVNCGALTRELLPSELFGHERGAFTGAVARKEGRLARADGGTVFLDEVGDLPLDAQVMLLRFLQSGEIAPVGSTQTRRLDVRVLAATHRDLERAIEREGFRADLYYRLRDMVIEVPPLRARWEDIARLVEHIRVQTNARCGLAIHGLTPEALALTEGLAWPGNVRELETVIRRAMILRIEGWVTAEDLDVGAARSRPLTLLQREALRLAAERQELRRADFMASCRISRQVAGRELAGLVRSGLLTQVGTGRGARYVRAAAPSILSRSEIPVGS
jgi:transcriptional regulator with GAF, ATPase, and Fis domain